MLSSTQPRSPECCCSPSLLLCSRTPRPSQNPKAILERARSQKTTQPIGIGGVNHESRAKAERIEKPPLSPAQVKAVADNMPAHLTALVVLSYLKGLRIGEALALKWSDVDFKQSKLCVRRSVWRRTEETESTGLSLRCQSCSSSSAHTLASSMRIGVAARFSSGLSGSSKP